MRIRTEVHAVVELGVLPTERVATEAQLAEWARRLQAVVAPLTDAEAHELLPCFGSNDCFGLAWTLLHLIETAPAVKGGHLLASEPPADSKEWHRRLWARARHR